MPTKHASPENYTWKKVMAPGSDQSDIIFRTAAVTVVILGLYASSLYSYILFHSLIEFSTIAIAFTLFILTWNARRFLTGGCLKALGIGYGLIALIDLLHSLAYKGMGIFPGHDANLPTQLWILARALQALLLCLSPLFARRNLNERVFLGISFAAVSVSTALVYLGAFPDCFIEGTGLTPFKIVSEYVISAFLLVALLLFIGARAAFNTRVFTLIVVSILCTIASELAFTSYVSVFGPANMAGHFLKLAAFYLIYRALVVTGFQEPLDLIFRDLKLAEQALTLEKEFSHGLLESMADGVVACDADGILALFNRSAREWHGLDPMKLPSEEWARHYDLFRSDGISPLPTDEIPLARAFRGEIVRDAGMAIKAKGQPIRFILANGSMIQDQAGQKLGAVVIMRDITEFGRLEQELRKANDELEQRVEKRTEELRQINIQLQNELAERAMIEKTLMLTQFSVDHAADSIMWINLDGRFCYTNEAASRLLGYSFAEFLEMKTSDVNPAHPVEEWPLHWAELKREKTLLFEAAFIRKDGTLLPVEIHANHVVFGDHEYNCASVRDITERKRMEDALFFVAQRGWQNGAENFFDALAQYLGENLDVDYVVIDKIDENPDIAETVALYAKGAIVPNMRYALKGTPCENVMGKRLCVYQQGVRQLFPEDILLAEMGVESYIGIPLWDASGEPLGLIALMGSKPLADVAAATQLLQLVAVRAAAELAHERNVRVLRTREHEFSTLAKNLPDNIVRYDRDGRTIYVNPVLEKTLGVVAAERIGKRVREFLPDGSFEAYAQALDVTLTSGENSEFEFILPVPGKEPVVHHIRMIAERDDHGEVTGVLAIGHDITERLRAEEAVMKLNEKLEQRVKERTAELEESQRALMNIVEDLNLKTEELERANSKLQELDRLKSMFIASMSHELRTPLNSIIGFSSIIRDEWLGPVNTEQKENLEIVLRSGKHLLSLINDVIDVSKIEAGKIESRFEEFDLYDLLTEAVQYVEKDLRDKGLDLRLAIDHQPIFTDKRRLLQCVINLLSNAVKFTEHGGVSVSSAISDTEQGVIVQHPPGRFFSLIDISVKDSGIGIAEEDIPQLFNAFVRLESPLKATVPGTGLGLYLTRKLVVEVLHGGILCNSTVGTGSTFTLRIPERIDEKGTGCRG